MDELNNIFHCSIDSKPIDADYSALNQKFETDFKVLKCKTFLNWNLLCGSKYQPPFEQ